MLDYQENRFRNGNKRLSSYQLNNLLPNLKNSQEYNWLNNINSQTLQLVCSELNESYRLHFLNSHYGMPRYKTKKNQRQSCPVGVQAFYIYNENYIVVYKVGKIKYKTDYNFQYGKKTKYKNIRISYNNGIYMISFSIECENQAPKLTDKSMGIDLGVKELAVVACGDEQLIFHNINKSKKVRELKRKLKHTQRTISRKYEASKSRTGKYEKTKNIEREEEKLRKIYARLTGIRQNYLHQTTHELVSMLPKQVVMEDLNVFGMMKNRHLSKSIAEQCFYEFIRQMKYKCEWNGIEFVQVPRFYPSSKTCSYCGSIKRDLKLSDRTYVCPDCGLIIDRDYNAAINLMKYGTH